MPQPIRDWISRAWNRIASGAAGGPTRIVITGNTVVRDWRYQEVNDPNVLRSLDNLPYEQETFTDHLGGRKGETELRQLLEKGGHLRIVYHPKRNQLSCVTEYWATRQLNRNELDVLLRYTKAQWSEGIGEGFACYSYEVFGYDVKCLTDPVPSVFQADAPVGSPSPVPFDRIAVLRLFGERGNPRAAFRLAKCYAEADGVAKNEAEAIRWYTLASQAGSTQAMVELGLCYLEGKGTPKQPERAVAWFRQAAQTEGETSWDRIARGYLGTCYENGQGVPKDEAEAFRCYLRSGDTSKLGACYEFGRGVSKDLRKALECYHESLRVGDEDVKPAIERIEAILGKSSR